MKCLKSPRLPRHKTRELAAGPGVVKTSEEHVDKPVSKDLALELSHCGVEGCQAFLATLLKQSRSMVTDWTGN